MARRGVAGDLHEAVTNADIATVKRLVAAGAPIDQQDGNNNTPLCIAAESGFRDITEFLLNADADPTVQGIDGLTPLHQAIFFQQTETISVLLQNPRLAKKYINIPNDLGDTPLHTAISQKNRRLIEQLIRANAEVSYENQDRVSPFKMVEKDKDLGQFFTRICKEEKDKIVSRLPGHVTTAADVESIFMAVEQGNLDGVAAKMHKGPNETNRGGFSLLHTAVQAWQPDVIRFLLDKNADINFSCTEPSLRTSPLHYACFGCNLEIVQLLVERRANVNSKDSRGNTPLHLAAEWKKPAIVEFLLSVRADHTQVDNSGYQPIHRAALTGRNPVLEKFLAAGCNINQPDKKGNTPLHLAALWGWFKTVRFLVEHNANMELTNSQRWTPLHVAAQNNQPRSVQTLLDLGADRGAIDNDGYSPLHLARLKKFTQVIELLTPPETQEPVKHKKTVTESQLKRLVAKASSPENFETLLQTYDIDPELLKSLAFSLARSGKDQLLELLLEYGEFDLASCFNEKQQTLLHVAAMGRSKVLCQEFLTEGVPVNHQDAAGQTVLHAVIAQKVMSTDILKLLCRQKKLNLALQDLNGNTVLHQLIVGSQTTGLSDSDLLKRLKLLLKSGKNLESWINLHNHQGLSALHCTITKGDNVEALQLLIEFGADVNLADAQGRSPLFLAVQLGRTACIKKLVWANAVIEESGEHSVWNAADSQTKKILIDVIEDKREIETKQLQQHSQAQNTQLFSELFEVADNPEQVSQWLASGGNVDALDDYGSTPLHVASLNGHSNTVKLLLEAQSNINAVDENLQTPLHLAVVKRHLEVVQELLAANADPNIYDAEDQTPLDWASLLGFNEIFEALSQHS